MVTVAVSRSNRRWVFDVSIAELFGGSTIGQPGQLPRGKRRPNLDADVQEVVTNSTSYRTFIEATRAILWT